MVFIGDLPLAMHGKVNLNPERLLLDIDDMIFAENIAFKPYGLYCVGADGMPVLQEDACGVYGTPVVAKEQFRIYMTDPKDASVEEGFTTIGQGMPLQVFRTDMESYLDFMTEDGRAIRLTIDGWYEEMEVHGFGSLSNAVEADPYGYYSW